MCAEEKGAGEQTRVKDYARVDESPTTTTRDTDTEAKDDSDRRHRMNWGKALSINVKIRTFLGIVHDPRWRKCAQPDPEVQAAIMQQSADQSMNLSTIASSYRHIKTTTKQKEQQFLEDLSDFGWGG